MTTDRQIDKLPEFPTFTPVTLRHQTVLAKYTSNYYYSDFSFASLWCWNGTDEQASAGTEVADLNGNLIIRLADFVTGERFLTFFGSKQLDDTLGRLSEFIAGDPTYLPDMKLVPESNLNGAALPDRYVIAPDRDNYDYVYLTSALAAMTGTAYRAHRNFLQRFRKQYTWEVKPLDLRSKQEWAAVLGVFAQWSDKKNQNGISVQSDTCALKRLPDVLERVPLLGIGIYIDGILRGYTINELQQDGYSTNLFEHAEVEYTGIFRVLKQETANRLIGLGYDYWNHQQDAGSPGLRKSKASYLPVFFLKKYRISMTTNIAG